MLKKANRINRVLLFLVLIIPLKAESADFFGKNYLRDVSSDSSEGKLTVRFEFNKPISTLDEPVFSDKSVHVDVPGALVRTGKRFYYTGDGRIPQIFVSQLSPGTLRLQFTLGGKFPELRESFQVEDQGRSLVFYIFKKEGDALGAFLARAANRMDSPEDREEAADPAPDQPAVKREPKNSEAVILDKTTAEFPFTKVSEKSSGLKIPSNPPLNFKDIRKRGAGEVLSPVSITVRTFAMFALVLAVMFLVFYLFKRFVLKNTIFGGNEKFVRVLGSGYLGARKNIVLAEVAGEILVLGTSNDHISLLTHIQDKEKIEQIKASGKTGAGKKLDNPPKGNDSLPPGDSSRPGGSFASYLKQYSGFPSDKEKSVEEVTELIRKNMGKLKTP